MGDRARFETPSSADRKANTNRKHTHAVLANCFGWWSRFGLLTVRTRAEEDEPEHARLVFGFGLLRPATDGTANRARSRRIGRATASVRARTSRDLGGPGGRRSGSEPQVGRLGESPGRPPTLGPPFLPPQRGYGPGRPGCPSPVGRGLWRSGLNRSVGVSLTPEYGPARAFLVANTRSRFVTRTR